VSSSPLPKNEESSESEEEGSEFDDNENTTHKVEATVGEKPENNPEQ